jgi:hypothetical protein
MTALDKLIEITKNLPDPRIEEVIKFVEWLKVREDGGFESWLMTLGWSDWTSKAEDEAWAYLDEEPITENKTNDQ